MDDTSHHSGLPSIKFDGAGDNPQGGMATNSRNDRQPQLPPNMFAWPSPAYPPHLAQQQFAAQYGGGFGYVPQIQPASQQIQAQMQAQMQGHIQARVQAGASRIHQEEQPQQQQKKQHPAQQQKEQQQLKNDQFRSDSSAPASTAPVQHLYPTRYERDVAHTVSELADLNINNSHKPTFNAEWSQDDEAVVRLFQVWAELPRSFEAQWTPEEEQRVAKRLERLIPFFDAHINHCDQGFLDFVARHQHAMDEGWTEFLPQYSIHTGLTTHGWSDEKWLSRYAYLAKLRERVVNHRLKVNLGLKGGQLESF